MKFRHIALFTLAGGLLCSSVLSAGQASASKSSGSAPTSATAPDPAKTPLIEELFRLMKPENMVQQAKTAIGNAAHQAFNAQLQKMGDDPSKYQTNYQQLQGRMMTIIDSKLDWQKMKPQLLKIYSDMFTKDELAGITAFYRSPAGQAEMRKMPEVAYKTNLLGQQQLASVQPDLQKVMTDALNQIKQKSQTTRPAPVKPKP